MLYFMYVVRVCGSHVSACVMCFPVLCNCLLSFIKGA